jgi:hypothetical protein
MGIGYFLNHPLISPFGEKREIKAQFKFSSFPTFSKSEN